MSEDQQSHEEWLEQERERLRKGFSYEPQPSTAAGKPSPADDVLAGLGLGAGVVGGALGPHPKPVAFQGVRAIVIAEALRAELPDDDTQVQVDRTDDAIVVTVLQSQEDRPHAFSPALTATLIETEDALMVTVSDLDEDAARGAVGSMAGTLVEQGKRALFRRRGVAGLIDAAGNVIEGVEDLIEDIQDLGLPRRVWAVIDRVGGAAEKAYLDQQRQAQELRRQREAAVRAWTHCEWCGHAYADDEAGRADCPTCGAPRGPQPAFLK
jgi:rubrerythrin